jgi:hypothetical protein
LYAGDPIKEIGEACSTHKKNGDCIQNLLYKTEEKMPLEDINEKII